MKENNRKGDKIMVMNFENGIPFDPGFVQHISAIIPNIQYVYGELNKYRNFGQKRNQFKMVYPKMINLIDKYLGFYAGCILWAEAVKTLDNKPITGNYCCGGEYNEEETLSEVVFLKEFLKYLPKDVKYYMGKDFSVNQEDMRILDLYEEFLKTNQGFVKVEKTNDLLVPDGVKPIDNVQKVFDKIEEVIENGNLTELKELV